MAGFTSPFFGGGSPASGTPTLIATFTATGTETSATFSSLSGYTHLQVIWNARSDLSGQPAASLHLQFNGDTTGNYDMEESSATGGTGGANQILGGNDIAVGIVPAATATSGLGGSGKMFIPDYLGTTFQKSLNAETNDKRSNSSVAVRERAGWWRSTAAITSMVFTLDGSSHFVSGSKIWVYGVL